MDTHKAKRARVMAEWWRERDIAKVEGRRPMIDRVAERAGVCAALANRYRPDWFKPKRGDIKTGPRSLTLIKLREARSRREMGHSLARIGASFYPPMTGQGVSAMLKRWGCEEKYNVVN
jgi:hypothetical protein